MSLRSVFCTFSRPAKPRFLRKPEFVKRTYRLDPLAECRPGIADALPKAPVIRGIHLSPPFPDERVLLPKYPENQLRRAFERVGNYMRKAIGERGGG